LIFPCLSLIVVYYEINVKKSQLKTVCKDDCGYITELKQQKSKSDIT